MALACYGEGVKHSLIHKRIPLGRIASDPDSVHSKYSLAEDASALRESIREFGVLYHEAWWAKRVEQFGWTKQEDIPADNKSYRSAAGLADAMKDAPCVVFALAVPPGSANSVIPAAQNLMLAARALGIGSVPTTLHPNVMDRFHAMFDIPRDVTFHFCIPLGYPQGKFGPTNRKPTAETTFLGRWGDKVPWT